MPWLPTGGAGLSDPRVTLYFLMPSLLASPPVLWTCGSSKLRKPFLYQEEAWDLNSDV